MLFSNVGAYLSFCMLDRFKKFIGCRCRLYLRVSGDDVHNCIPNVFPLFATHLRTSEYCKPVVPNLEPGRLLLCFFKIIFLTALTHLIQLIKCSLNRETGKTRIDSIGQVSP